MSSEKATLEINTSAEWLRVFSAIDFSEVDDADENDAANAFTTALGEYLDAAGFSVERARGQRTTVHGWNGANTFTHKLGPVGTFDALTDDDQREIELAIEKAESTMRRFWVKQTTNNGGES